MRFFNVSNPLVEGNTDIMDWSLRNDNAKNYFLLLNGKNKFSSNRPDNRKTGENICDRMVFNTEIHGHDNQEE